MKDQIKDQIDRQPKGHKAAVVLSSGGADSTTAMAIAAWEEGFEIYSLSFDYGQKNRYELECARKVARFFKVREHLIIPLNLRLIGGSALTADEIAIPRRRPDEELSSAIPPTYVPARNLIFLSLAVAWAEVLGIADIFIGVNAIDYSGYPDCRPAFIDSFQKTANLGTRMGTEGGEGRITIHAPLINLTKGEILRKGLALGVDYHLTSSCYEPDPFSGRPCGQCDSCRIRQRGFASLGLDDPCR
ncbi:MAG: 7-cyano-7-deazaguanine synthase QueC [bacterium]|nr:7-cyano-7-deazaguanine synthase QueC [bacterium]